MTDTKIILDSHLTRRDEAAGFVNAAILAAGSATFAGGGVTVDARECEVLTEDFSHEFIELLLVQMKAGFINVTGGPEHIVRHFNIAATTLDLHHQLLIDGAAAGAPAQTPRTVATQVFARVLGERIADRRTRHAITGVFAEELVRYSVTATAEQRAVMANEVSKRILADTVYDDETSMARRAVTSVLTENFGESLSMTGPWIENETISVNGKTHRLTGRSCPQCSVGPVCRGTSYLSNYCASCDWFDVPF